MTFSKQIAHEKRYFCVPQAYIFPGHEVKSDGLDFIVYHARAGWIAESSSFVIGKKRLGAGWIGFETKEEAASNFINKIKTMASAK